MPAEASVAVAGLGALGTRVAEALDRGIDGLVLNAVSAADREAARRRVSGFSRPPPVLPLAELAGCADIAVECLPPERFREVAEPVLSRGATLVAASAGALLGASDLLDLAQRRRARIVVPSGALAGIDGLRAAAEAGLESVTLVTRKPPGSFGDALLAGGGEELTAPIRLFSGSAREAVERFPKNVNVAATVSLAGLGPDRTVVEVWADPNVVQNQHELRLSSAAGEVTALTLNLPDPANPRSSMVTAFSIVAALRRLTATISFGS